MFNNLDDRIEEEITTGKVSDVCFGVGPNEDVHLFSSRAALAMASPVFETMFFGPHWHAEAVARALPLSTTSPRALHPPVSSVPGSRKSTDDCSQELRSEEGAEDKCPDVCRAMLQTGFRHGQHHYVAVVDVEPSALKCLLRYVHHLNPQLSLDNALHVFRAADKYQIDGLLEACKAFIDTNADPYSVRQVLRLFDIACRLGLEMYSQLFLSTLGGLSRVQTRQVLRAEEFLALHAVSLATLLNSDGLCVDEERLWKALRRWAELRAPLSAEALPPEATAEPDEARKALIELAPTERVSAWQDALRPLKHLIRFPAMSEAFFAEEVSRAGVLSQSEVVEIFCHMAASKRKDQALWDPLLLEDTTIEEACVAGAFKVQGRVNRLGWCSAPGADPALSQELGITEGRELMGMVGSVVVDGRGLSTSSWGSSVVLAGPGTGFYLAFGSVGFSSGRHAWTISWRPMDSLQPGRTRCSRGGAAGIAREMDAHIGDRVPVSANAVPPVGLPSAKAGPSTSGPPSRVASASGGLSQTNSIGAGLNSASGTEEPSARFLDWPSCIVFGVKRDVVTEGRYVAWEEDLSSSDCIQFSIQLDFDTKTITYIADRGERCWTGPLVHDGPVYPVIAASGPHYFHIEYGGHV